MIRPYWEAGGHIPEPPQSAFSEGIKTILLVIGIIVVAFGVLYACFSISSWAVVGFVALLVAWLWAECRGAMPV